MSKKFELKEALPEDQLAFKQGLEELLNKLSLNLVINIMKVPVGIKSVSTKAVVAGIVLLLSIP